MGIRGAYAMNLSPNAWFAASRIKATQLLPYFSSAIMGLVPYRVEGAGTLFVTDRGVLGWDPALSKRWTVENMAWVIIHEALHYMRDHAGRRAAAGAEPRAWNLAADCVAPGTRILLTDGTERRIEHMRAGDSVFGVQQGRLVRGSVIAVLQRNRGGETGVEFRYGNKVLNSTYEHRFLTRHGYVTARQSITENRAEVFALREGAYRELGGYTDNPRDCAGAWAALSECVELHARTRVAGTTRYSQATELDAVAATFWRAAGVLGGHCGWGRDDYRRTALQQAAKQNVLPTVCAGEQYERATQGMANGARLFMSFVLEQRENTLLENVGRWFESWGSLSATASMAGHQTPAGTLSDRVVRHASEAATQRQADPTDVPDLARASAFELALPTATRVPIAQGTIYYDILTTCHSFIANGYAVHNCEINDDLREAGAKFPALSAEDGVPPERIGQPSGVFPETFGCTPGRLAEEYYAAIRKTRRSPKSKSGKSAPGIPQCGDAGCGSGAGAEPSEAETKIPTDMGKSKAEQKRIQRTVAEAVRVAAQGGRGNVPSGIQRWAEEVLGPSRIPWQQKLAQLCRNAVAYRAGAGDYRYDRPSRRQSAFGYGSGSPVFPALRMPIPRVAVIVDTSGSMGREELAQGLAEVKAILAGANAQVDFFACDAAVHVARKVRNITEVMGLLKGGGGTDMRPAFDAVAKLPQPSEVIICATDGMIGDPGPKPRAHVIWLAVGSFGDSFHPPWGEVVRLNNVV